MLNPNLVYDEGKGLEKIVITAKRDSSVKTQRWAGYDAAIAKNIYKDLRALGTQSKAHYVVEFIPLSTAPGLGALPMFGLSKDLCGLLVSEADYPVLAIDTDAKKIGGFNINQVTGYQAPEITLTFLETQQNYIIDSLQQWSELMVNDDGTFNPPGTYAAEMIITLFDRAAGRSQTHTTSRFIVAPTMATNTLSATDPTPILLPVTFTQLRQFG